MPKTYKLLLTESVEALGIVGDVVTVRAGYARNFLLPRSLATTPSEEKIAALAEKRAEAERQLAEQRRQRESLVSRLDGFELTLERATNDQGLLYGSVTQQDIVSALASAGFGVRPRDVRLGQTIKRIGDYDVSIKPESDLEATVKLRLKSDRPLDLHKEEPAPAAAPAPAAEEGAAPADSESKPREKKAKPDRASRDEPKSAGAGHEPKPPKGSAKVKGEKAKKG